LGYHQKKLNGVTSKKIIGAINKKWEKNDNLTRNKQTLNKKLPEGFLLAYKQATKINLIGCDTIVNSPSLNCGGLVVSITISI
jgi:hypothetical protein